MKRFIQIVLWINIAIDAVVGFTGYVLHVGPAGLSQPPNRSWDMRPARGMWGPS